MEKETLAVRVDSGTAEYRLKRNTHGELVLQRCFKWQQGKVGGDEWRDLETVVEEGNMRKHCKTHGFIDEIDTTECPYCIIDELKQQITEVEQKTALMCLDIVAKNTSDNKIYGITRRIKERFGINP